MLWLFAVKFEPVSHLPDSLWEITKELDAEFLLKGIALLHDTNKY